MGVNYMPPNPPHGVILRPLSSARVKREDFNAYVKFSLGSHVGSRSGQRSVICFFRIIADEVLNQYLSR